MKRRIGAMLLAVTLTLALPPVPALAEDGAANALIEASRDKPIKVGVVDNSAPVSYWNDERGAYEGIIIDMLSAVSDNTGLQFELFPVDMSRRAQAGTPAADSPQLVLGITYCDSLPDDRGWLLSQPLHADTLAVVGMRGSDLSLERAGKKVAVMAEFGMALEFAKLRMPDYEIATYPTLYDCLDAVVEGRADTAVYLRSCISHLLQRPYYYRLEYIPIYSEGIYSCVGGFTAAAEPLIRIINDGLSRVAEDESRTIALNYTVMNPYKLTMEDTLYQYRIPIIVIALLMLLVIASFVALTLIRRRSAGKVKDALVLAERASAAKGDFMSRMSHEIRTPLNAVIGYNTIARGELAEAKTDAERRQAEMKVLDCLAKSDIASRHLLSIINDVLDMSAIESGKIKVISERFDFKGLISSLTAIFYSQAKAKNVDFDVRFDSCVDEWLIGDQMRLNQVLTNLLSNAVKFTPEGGKVTLRINADTLPQTVRISFEVKDTGIGMSPEYMARIWSPFEQADTSISQRFGGTGLGLSITKTLVDLMGGTVDVSSEPSAGSVFNVALSFVRTEQPEARGPYDFTGVNVLVVDDDPSTCDYVRLLLTRSGVRSTSATSGAEALAAVSLAIKERSPYTLCLVDWRMPRMDGIETIKKIRELTGKNIPIIVITSYDIAEVSEQAAGLGVNMFVSKPLFQSSLFNLLANVSGNPACDKPDKGRSYSFEGMRLLLAEDNAMNMEIANKILTHVGFTVDCVWNGQEAVDAFEASPPGTYQAILMDVQMPVMDGYRATRLIRMSAHPEAGSIPIIAMSADAFAENRARSLASGMDAHVSKPVEFQVLFDTLNEHIHMRSR